jgi:aminoglycoside phosphotransferase (APT) family kinase protein
MPGRVEAFLAALDPARSATVREYELIVGGWSRVMAKATIAWDDGSEEVVVLRGDPPAGESLLDTDRDAEWALLATIAEQAGVAIPALRGYDATGEHLGTKCIVMDFCPGSTLQRLITEAEDLTPFAGPFVDTLAAVHTVEPDVLPAAMAKPTDWDGYIDENIAAWAAAERALPISIPAMHYVGAWLAANRPPPVPLTLVHGDFQPSNILVADDGAYSVVDWEVAHVGDPREDLGAYLSYGETVPPSLYYHDPEAFLARYRERTGLSELQVNATTVGWFSVLAMLNLLGRIMQGVGAMAVGFASGTVLMYTINAVTSGMGKNLRRCAALTEPMAELRAAIDAAAKGETR